MATQVKRGRRYFVAGAMWNGKDDQYDRFVKLGIWESGWDPKTDEYAPIISQIHEGDRIAIKKGMGPGTSETLIRAIGIVKGVDVSRGLVYVDWVLTGMKRKVHSRGCYSTIHGPYRKSDADIDLANWLSRIFSIWPDATQNNPDFGPGFSNAKHNSYYDAVSQWLEWTELRDVLQCLHA